MWKDKLAAFSSLLSMGSRPLVGLDISSSGVKLVELEEVGGGRHRVLRYHVEPLPRDAIKDGDIQNFDVVVEAVRRLIKQKGSSKIRHVAISLPSSMAISKKMLMPADLDDSEMEAMIEAEVSQFLPFDLSEVNLDFTLLPSSGAVNSSDVEVLVAAAKKEKVDSRVAVVEAAGLEVAVVDVEVYAVQNAIRLIANQLPASAHNQVLALVDIGAYTTQLYVIRNQQLLFSREQSFGGGQLTYEIQRAFSLSMEEAEVYKKQGGLPESYEADVLIPYMDTLASEVSRALQFFFASSSYNTIDHVILAGGASLVPKLDKHIEQRTNIHTIMANPFAVMSVANTVRAKQLIKDAPMLMVACGLAMRRFDS
ncbi:MAG: pilus assembly protein PilM [Pseudomonadota bacterium]